MSGPNLFYGITSSLCVVTDEYEVFGVMVT